MKTILVLILILITEPGHKFSHVTAELSWHVQSWDLALFCKQEQHDIFITAKP